MGKSIVILLDGTSNTISAQRTNVLRLYGALRKTPTQVVYYDPGVGTLGDQDSWSLRRQRRSEIWGMATGAGIDTNVKEAYRFLVETYQRSGTGRDRIYLFGFSRGAYAARMLAGLIRAIGLIEPRNLNLLDYAYRAYKRADPGTADGFDEISLYRRILEPDVPPVRLLGLFDTVASVIEPGAGLLPSTRTHPYTSENDAVRTVRHAVSLEERRRLFDLLPWEEGQLYRGEGAPQPQDAKQVWFSGFHADVGGGYPEPEAALAKIPLAWMIEQTRPLGLDYDDDTVARIVLGADPAHPKYVAPDPAGPAHESMTFWWRLIELLPLPLTRRADTSGWKPRFAARPVPRGAAIHRSVLERARALGTDVPANVPEDHRVVDG